MPLFEELLANPRFKALSQSQQQVALTAALDSDIAENPRVKEVDRPALVSARDELVSKTIASFAAPTNKESGLEGFLRGAEESVTQLKPLGYGLVAGGAAAAEAALGTGGISTGVKKWAVGGMQDAQQEISKDAQPTDSLSFSLDAAKKGDISALADWAAHGVGYVGGQAIQLLMGAGASKFVAQKALAAAAPKIIEGLVTREATKIAAGEAITPEIMKAATAKIAGAVGEQTFMAGAATGMEGGEIGGGIAERSVKEDRALTGKEVGKMFTGTIGAAMLEYAENVLNLKALKGKIPTPAAEMTGVGGRLTRGAAAAGTVGASEGAQEGAQTMIEQWAEGKDTTTPASRKEQFDAAGMGALFGGAAFVGGAATGPRSAPMTDGMEEARAEVAKQGGDALAMATASATHISRVNSLRERYEKSVKVSTTPPVVDGQIPDTTESKIYRQMANTPTPELPPQHQAGAHFDALMEELGKDSAALQAGEDVKRVRNQPLALPVPPGKTYGDGFTMRGQDTPTTIRRPGVKYGDEEPFTAGKEQNPAVVYSRQFKSKSGAIMSLNQRKRSGSLNENYDVVPSGNGMWRIESMAAGQVGEAGAIKQSQEKQQSLNDMVRSSPVYAMVQEIRKAPLNLDQIRQDYGPDTIAQINKKFPGIFSEKGTTAPDEAAEMHGYEGTDQLIEALKSAPTIKESLQKHAEPARYDNVDKMVADGLDPVFEKMPAGNLTQGDEIEVGTGSIAPSDRYKVKGYENGQVVLQDGVQIKVDPWDELNIEGRKATGKEMADLPERLAAAVGKPEQVKTLEQMGVTDTDAQAAQIVRDAVAQPMTTAEALRNRGYETKADELEAKARENGSKLKEADGVVTDREVNAALKKGVVASEEEANGRQEGRQGEGLLNSPGQTAEPVTETAPASSPVRETQADLSVKSETQKETPNAQTDKVNPATPVSETSEVTPAVAGGNESAKGGVSDEVAGEPINKADLPGNEGDYTVAQVKEMGKVAGATRAEISEAVGRVKVAPKPEATIAADKMDSTDKPATDTLEAATDKNVPTETDNQGTTGERAQEKGKTVAEREGAASNNTNEKGKLYSKTTEKTGTTVAQVETELRTFLGKGFDRLAGKGKLRVVQSVAELPGGENLLNMVAYHGSPHRFDKFSVDNIGTGEGAQAYGHGLYFTEKKEVAEWYRGRLSRQQEQPSVIRGNVNFNDLYGGNDFPSTIDDAESNFSSFVEMGWLEESDRRDFMWVADDVVSAQGATYEVELTPSEDEYLLWDKPLSEQSEKVKAIISAEFKKGNVVWPGDWDGGAFYSKQSDFEKSDKAASEYLHSLGIRGIKYLDGTSRGVSFQLEWKDGENGSPEVKRDAESAMLLMNEDTAKAISYLREKGKTSAATAIESGALVQRGENFNYVIFNDEDVSITALYSKDGSIAGTYDPATGQITLVADNVKPGQAEYIMLHEGLHSLMREDALFSKQHDAILDQFEAKRKYDYRVQDAFRRVPEDTPAHLVREEAMAYWIESKANHTTSLFKKIIANIRMWLMRMGIPMKNLTTDDLVALVTQGVHRLAKQDHSEDVRGMAGEMEPVLHSKASETVSKIKSSVEQSGAVKGVALAYDGIKRAVAPGQRSDDARNAADILTEQMGKNFQQTARTKGELNEISKKYSDSTSKFGALLDEMQTSTGVLADGMFAKMPKTEQYDFISRIQNEEPQKSQELQDIADTLSKMFDDLREEANEVVPGSTGHIEGYFPGMWEKPDAAGKFFGSKKFEGTKAHTKSKVFDTIDDGIKAGFIPRGTPLDMAFEKMHDMQKFISAHRVLQQMVHEGVAELIPAGEKARPGYSLVPEPYGVITKADEKSYKYAVQEDVAQVFTNYLSSSLYNNKYVGPIYSGYMGVANRLNQFQLGVLSAFHAGFTGMESVISHFALGVKALARGNVAAATKFMVESPTALWKNPILGGKVLEAFRGGDVVGQEIPQIVQWLQMAGARDAMDNRMRTATTDSMLSKFAEGKKFAAAIRSPAAMVEQMARPILEWLVPRQKFGVFSEMAMEWNRVNPGASHEEMRSAMQYIWNRVDSRLGQVVYERLFAHNVAKNIVQGLIRAPGWTGGTIIEVGGGLNDFAKVFRDIKAGKRPQMTDKMAYTISLLTITGLVNGIMTAILTGEPPDEKDLLAFRTGNIDENGNQERFLLPTYAKDIYAYLNKPGTTLLNKTHPLLSLMADIAKNRDYYGVQIRDKQDNVVGQAADTGKYVAKAFIPFWMRGVDKAQERGDNLPSMLAPMIGIMPATSEFTKSKAQRLMSEIAADRPQFPITPEQFEKRKLKHKLEMRLRNGDPSASRELTDAVKDGTLSVKDVMSVRRNIKTPAAALQFKRLGIEDAIRVFDAATPEEKKVFRPIMYKKRALIDKLPAAQVKDVKDAWREALLPQ